MIHKILHHILLLMMLTGLSAIGRAQHSQFPYSCGFETGFDGWEDVTGLNATWTIGHGNAARKTDNKGFTTGPDAAHGGTAYAFVNLFDNSVPGKEISMQKQFDFSNMKNPIITLFAHSLWTMGDGATISVSAKEHSQQGYRELISNYEQMGEDWYRLNACLTKYVGLDNVDIKITVKSNGSRPPNIAVDDILIEDFLVQAEVTNTSCFGSKDGSIKLTATGGGPIYKYSVDHENTYEQLSQNTYQATDLKAGAYASFVIDVLSGCKTYDMSVKVTQPPEIVVTPEIEDVKCYGDKSGAIKATASETDMGNDVSQLPYQFSIDGGLTFQYTGNFTNLEGGQYTIIAQNRKGCWSAPTVVAIGDDVLLEFAKVTVQNVERCYGDETATIDISANFGENGPLDYSIDGGATYHNGLPNFSALGAGKYELVIRDKNYCKIKLDSLVIITQPEQFVYDNVEVLDIDGCYGDANGVLNIHVSGGHFPYSYSINSGITYLSEPKFTGLKAGKYNLRAKDSSGCVVDIGETIISQPDPLKITSVEIDNVTTCYGDLNGHIRIKAQGGNSDLKYNVTTQSSMLQSEKDFYGLGAGYYLPYVEDNKGCQYLYEKVEITQPTKFTMASASKFDGDIRCYGDKSGVIYALANGGTLPYTYSIDGFANSKTINALESCIFNTLPAGEYTVSAKDKMGCLSKDTVLVIEQPTQLKITKVELSNVLCYGEKSGYAILTASGGNDNYSYGYSRNNEMKFSYLPTNKISNLGAEVYDFAVKDGNGCLAYAYNRTITQPDALEFLSINTYPVQGCYGESTGTIILGGKGGTKPYQYSIDGGDTYQNSVTFGKLPGGNNYIPAIKDKNGCIVIGSTEVVGQPNEVRINNITFNEVQGCFGSKNGYIKFEGDGGTGQLTYKANGYSNKTGEFSNLPAGIYNLVVYDERGCTDTHPDVKIDQPDKMAVDSTYIENEKCYGDHIGKFHITVVGGRALQEGFPYYFYLGDVQDPTNYDGLFDNLAAGKYDYRVRDKYGCELSGNFTITEPDAFVVSSLDTVNVNTCHGDQTGYIKVKPSGGIKPLKFNANGYNFNQDNETGVFSNLNANQYHLTITDANECVADTVVTLIEPTSVTFKATLTKTIDCHDEGLAEIVISADGGCGNYSVSIDDGKNFAYTPGTITGLHAGNYVIHVKDINKCEAPFTQSIKIDNPPALSVEAETEDVICYDGNTGKIIASAFGGTKPYDFSIDKATWQANTGTFKNLSDGIYVVTVRDLKGCTAETEALTINRPPNMAGFTVDVNEGCSPLEIVITQDYSGLSNYVISNGDMIFDRTAPTHYTIVNDGNTTQKYKIECSIMLKDGVGCTDTSSAYVTVHPQPKVDFGMSTQSSIWPDRTADFVVLNKNLTTVHWDFGDGTTSNNINEDSHIYEKCGNYNIILIGSDGRCSDTVQHNFTIEGRPIMAVFNADKLEGCEPITVKFENISLNSDSCRWDFGDGSNPVYNAFNVTHTYSAPGSYQPTLTIYGDCESQTATAKTIMVYNKPTAAFSQNLDTLYEGQYLKLDCESSTSDHYMWNFGDGNKSEQKSPTHKYEKDGIYNLSLVVTTEHSCTDTAMVKNAVVVITHPIVIFPNAFTPNNDGLNDRFMPIHGDVRSYEIIILNRYGNVMYRSTNINEGWDGTRNGVHCPPGLYVYKAKVVMRDEKFIHLNGKIILLR